MENLRQKALEFDNNDVLAPFRNKFHMPTSKGSDCIYFTGNSLGLMPKNCRNAMVQEMEDWATYGVDGHFEARTPWYNYHEQLMKIGAETVGAKNGEVVHMNGLTTNIHLLMVSFYRPTKKRFKIICEAKAFPSDQYALESQVKFHGFDPAEAIISVEPKEGEHLIEQSDIDAVIKTHSDSIALIFWGGVNYYSGQFFDLEHITKAGHEVGAIVGFDLAHAAGNVPLLLHDWDVDFASWCTYKYFNSGPGSVAGIYIHERHGADTEVPRFSGWWGHDKQTRFEMKPGFVPMTGAEGWQLSNAPIFSMAPHLVSLKIFEEAGMSALREKSILLTNFLEQCIKHAAYLHNANIEVITPKNQADRGCQLSISMKDYGKELFDYLSSNGVFADWREPNVIRVAPVPLYNSFEDCYKFGRLLDKAFHTIGNTMNTSKSV